MALFDVDNLTFRAHGERFMDEWKTGKAHPAYSNLMKYVGTELNKKRNELVMSIGGSQALEWGKRSLQWRVEGAQLAPHQSELDRRRHQRSHAERGVQAYT